MNASTINGEINFTTAGVQRARVSTVNGNIRFAGDPGTQGLVDIDDYGGTVDVALAAHMGGACEVTTVFGRIDTEIPSVRPVAGAGGRGQSLTLAVGHGTARVTVRTFKGDVRVTVPSGEPGAISTTGISSIARRPGLSAPT